MANKWEKNVGQGVGYDTDSLIESYRKITQNTDNADRYDSALSNMSQLIQRREDWLRSQPAAQVERLMAAGMSRAQALAALNSSGESPVAETGVAGNVEQSETERMNVILGVVSSAAQLAEQAVAIGSQIGLAKSTIAVNSIQAQLYAAQSKQIGLQTSFARLQYDSLSDVAMFMQAANNYEVRSGQKLPDSWDDALNVLRSVDFKGMPDVYSMSHDRYPKALENPYFYPAMLTQWRDKRRNDYDIATERKRLTAEAEFSQISIAALNQEIINAKQDFKVKQAEEQNLKAGARLSSAQVVTEGAKQNNLSSQSALFYEQYSRTYKENEAWFSTDENGVSHLRKRIEGESQASYYAGALAAIQYDMQDNYVTPLQQHILLRELKSWRSMPETYWKQKRDNMMKSEENQRIALDVLSMSLSNNEEFRQKFPNLSTLFDLFDSYGIFDAALRSFTTLGASSILGSSQVGASAIGAGSRLYESPPPHFGGAGKW